VRGSPALQGDQARAVPPAEELARLGPALAAEQPTNPYHVAAILVLAFTGARPTEILTLKRDRLRLDQGMVMLHRKGRWLPLYLPKPAIAVLESLEQKDGNPYVFPGNAGGAVSMSRLQQLWWRVRAAAEIDDVRLYDLRHTLASMALNAGASLEIIGGLLGHTVPATTKRYAHLAALPVRAAGERVAEEIDVAMGRRVGK